MTTSSSPETLEQSVERLESHLTGDCPHGAIIPSRARFQCRLCLLEFVRSAMRLFAESAIAELTTAIEHDANECGTCAHHCEAIAAIRRLAEEKLKP